MGGNSLSNLKHWTKSDEYRPQAFFFFYLCEVLFSSGMGVTFGCGDSVHSEMKGL